MTARARVGATRPTVPTEHPYAPPKRYACIGCGAAVELELLAPLPAGWVTVRVATPGVGTGAGLAYRCANCARAAKKDGQP